MASPNEERAKLRHTQALLALTDEQEARFKAVVNKAPVTDGDGKPVEVQDAVINKMLELMEAYDWKLTP